jgi:hypothetical protein
MRLLPWLVIILAACTSHNPSYVGNEDLSSTSKDMAGPADLSGPMGSCGAGERKCAGTSASDGCERGMFVVDRQCPAGSICNLTYCAPPATMLPTQIGQRCDVGGPQQVQCMANRTAMLACQPFVDPNDHSLHWFCDKAVGKGGAGTSCKQGSECQSGLCGSNGTCFVACQMDFECTNGLKCDNVQIVVEGVRVQAGSCAP